MNTTILVVCHSSIWLRLHFKVRSMRNLSIFRLIKKSFCISKNQESNYDISRRECTRFGVANIFSKCTCLYLWDYLLYNGISVTRENFTLNFLNSQGMFFRCSPPIFFSSKYVIEYKKLRDTCFFLSAQNKF